MSTLRKKINVTAVRRKDISNVSPNIKQHAHSNPFNATQNALPSIYSGQGNRLQRYTQYESMDKDSVVNLALDTIADFCTQVEEINNLPFVAKFSGTPNDTEVKVIDKALRDWSKLNNFKSRLWYIFRGVIKYGDQFFVRDPETFKLLWVDQYNVDFVELDSTNGMDVVSYLMRNVNYNEPAMSATPASNIGNSASNNMGAANMGNASSPMIDSNTANSGMGVSTRANMGVNNSGNRGTSAARIEGKNVVHFSLNVGMNANFPFGESILEGVFKVFKQKELLEDAIIIYRIQRAPERRMFKIDVGEMNPTQAAMYIERVKNEMHQRKIPNRTGKGNSIPDAAYDPLMMLEDYFFPITTDGRGSSVEVLPGGDMAGEIGDLEFFTKQLRESLKIPASYMPNSDGVAYSDGKTGVAMIQEFMFNKYCMRLQSMLDGVFDSEFKKYLEFCGYNIDNDLFDIELNPPQNFSSYREAEIQSTWADLYTKISDNKILSERFKLRYFLNLSDGKIAENEELWAQENPQKVEHYTAKDMIDDIEEDDLSTVGIGSDEESDDEL